MYTCKIQLIIYMYIYTTQFHQNNLYGAYMLFNKCLSFFIYSFFKIHTDSHNTESFRFGIQRFFVRIA